ncbi:MAG TPA: acyl carrier protein [Fibrobacteria bacterium]|nr:acyl carrier protein [Fibrobacteria bacterium]
MANQNDIKQQIREFVIENFLMGDASSMLKDGESFLETGTIDSTGVLEVVTFLESQFNLKVDDKDLVPENLDSVNNLVRYVERRKHAS